MTNKKEQVLTAAKLKELFSYDPETGHFTRLKRGGSSGKNVSKWQPGQIAGSITNRGYIAIRIDGYSYSAHRLAVLYMTGEWPKDSVDHSDGDFANNAWGNLRECTHAENLQNMKIPTNCTSGYVGVYWKQHKTKPWVATITVEGKRTFLGHYPTPQDAHTAYLAAKAKMHRFQPVPREMAAA
ncbi:hypothetical protein EN858_15025 [Mesorhizobium sp. M4B.F.Ca.ET.215.01.1.1]|uniref:HNH endonuclease signature motif containing protein n=1 Tax=unclassified Mesorhizobium TaxID=325217 RepID=UPI001093A96B|nr:MULTISPECIES: HNH endonuclease signature motif containing protein [unclassified Mesorhizobium]TGQ11232.1 hypothetical protein EN858_15025 [Mesorhizobium sp. M4B.F.Ca.ET.215.01.1.1]TGR04715.1 hypothetical protein EN846_13055 [Mesorhizobium sp. M4B.F.Ca.ET.203.01.1.1]